MTEATIGRIVLYTLTEADAAAVNLRRKHAELSNVGGQRTGVQVHAGNVVTEGDVFPAVVVRELPFDGDYPVNLKVLLDGNDDLWATSVHEGYQPGSWSWPVRV